MTSKPPESVLVYVGFDRIGDGFLKLPFVRGLRAAFPDARITWLAGREDSVYAGVLAQDFCGPEMRYISLDAVEGALEKAIKSQP